MSLFSERSLQLLPSTPTQKLALEGGLDLDYFARSTLVLLDGRMPGPLLFSPPFQVSMVRPT
jgi:hypothetical protein